MIKHIFISFLNRFSLLSEKTLLTFVLGILIGLLNPIVGFVFVASTTLLRKSKGKVITTKTQQRLMNEGLYILVFREDKNGFKDLLKKGMAYIDPRDAIHAISRNFEPCVFMTIGKPSLSEIKAFFHLDVNKSSRKVFLLKIEPHNITTEMFDNLRFTNMDRFCTYHGKLVVPAKVVSLKRKQLETSNAFFINSLYTVVMTGMRTLATRGVTAFGILVAFYWTVNNPDVVAILGKYPFLLEVFQNKVDIYLGDGAFRYFS